MRVAAAVAVALVSLTALAQNPPVTVNVNTAANRRAIDSNIYGAAFASTAVAGDLNLTLNRSGGNAMSRHNWQNNTTNRAVDWFFENIPDTVDVNVPGAFVDAFIADSRAAGARPIITIPMMDYLPKDRAVRCGYPRARFPEQQSFDVYNTECGNGHNLAGQRIRFTNVISDTSTPVGPAFQAAWVDHLVKKWGPASTTGVRYYGLDNEPVLWSFSHFDIHPSGSTYNEMRTRMIDYASAIKAVDPGAKLLGPEEWGWTGYFWSGLDAEAGLGADRDVNMGGVPYIDWLLQQMRGYHEDTGTRLLDYLTVHFYPQSGEFSENVTPAMQALRNRSTRALWDPSYVDESWIKDVEGGIVRLIPRLHDWVANHYPGTKTGLTEYNWGAENHMNGATAQADILGILGREGVDMAVRWVAPAAGTPVYNAFKMYRNYDGNNGMFGDISVAAGGPNPDVLSSFAAVRSRDNALTIIIVSKALTGTTPVTVNIASHAITGPAIRWQLAANAISQQPAVSFSGGSAAISVPAQSVTLLVVPGLTALEAHGDFDGDGRDDILLETPDAALHLWRMNGATVSSAALVGSLGAYSVAGLGDLTGDGKSDIVLRDAAGNIGLWAMNGSAITAGALIGSPAAYSVAAVADFSGDGKSDILLRDSRGDLGMWIMNGAAITAGGFIGSPGAYTVAAAADFNGDAKADILLRDSLGNLGMWLMNGSAIVAGGFVGSPGTYSVVGANDFDGDGKADIILRDALGNIGMWRMDGTAITAGALVGSPGAYLVNSLGDYDGNARADMLLRQSETGDLGMWFMNGSAITGGGYAGTTGPSHTAY